MNAALSTNIFRNLQIQQFVDLKHIGTNMNFDCQDGGKFRGETLYRLENKSKYHQKKSAD